MEHPNNNDDEQTVLQSPTQYKYSEEQKHLAGFAGMFLFIDIATVIIVLSLSLPCDDDSCSGFFWWILTFALFDAIANSLVIYAIFRAHPKIICVWLIYRSIGIALGVILLVYSVIGGNWTLHSVFYSSLSILLSIWSIWIGKTLKEDMELSPYSYRRGFAV
ncbi:uncharacterized protein LOC110857159 [Folsomia candida]|uniref:Uncharacterized protein n=1 Tax=Folsomia candida TaxID=158441 RepID=A0A226DIL9_FOLCA|nr:uncharacterized protein LOC110857159 [Folsomia candida]OXA45029.1 hypothetical protein Fcan01_20331 [Folsomia candida]